MKVKIVRKWEDKFFVYGYDIKGQLFLKCKVCDKNMMLFDMSFVRNVKQLKYVCGGCGKIKTI